MILEQSDSTSSRRSPESPAPDVRTPREVALQKPLPERVPWEELGPEFFAAWGYPRGEFMPEHMSIYGKTGRGKSHFEAYILRERARLRGSRVVIIATKPADKTLTRLGWPVVSKWPPETGWTKKRERYHQVIYWAKAPGLTVAGKRHQAAKVQDLLEKLWVPEANVIVVFDEIAYVENELNLPPDYPLKMVVGRYFREGRGLGITVVATTQRPANVSRSMHSETEWSVFFAPKDEEDAERLAQIAGNKLYFKRALYELDASRYEFLLVNNLTGESYISSLSRNPRPIDLRVPSSEVPKKQPVVA